MNTACSNTEKLKGYIAANPGSASPTGVTIEQTTFNIITVFNETDQDVKIAYKAAKDGGDNHFYVPKAGRQFTRVVNGGIIWNSLTVQALTSDASGNVFINLGS